jgi:hypothetical protein
MKVLAIVLIVLLAILGFFALIGALVDTDAEDQMENDAWR